jgi:hypothetical protein
MQNRICLSLLVVGAVLAATHSTVPADWKKNLEESLKGRYELTKTGLDRIRITKPGTVLVIRKEGISGDLASDMTFLNNKVIEGQVAQAGGFGASLQAKKSSRVFRVGEKVYLFKIDVKDDAVLYFLISCETYDVNAHGSTKQTRYKSLLTFEFPKGFLESADADTVKRTVDAVVTPEAEAQAGSTKTVALGQTPEQVEAILGKPEKIVELGPKKIYVYKDMKIVFADDKVADVQ